MVIFISFCNASLWVIGWGKNGNGSSSCNDCRGVWSRVTDSEDTFRFLRDLKKGMAKVGTARVCACGQLFDLVNFWKLP